MLCAIVLCVDDDEALFDSPEIRAGIAESDIILDVRAPNGASLCLSRDGVRVILGTEYAWHISLADGRA
jgi:hypothetical protein